MGMRMRLHEGLLDYTRYVIGCSGRRLVPWEPAGDTYKTLSGPGKIYLQLLTDLWQLYTNLHKGLLRFDKFVTTRSFV